jgi:hypothetical protein
MPVRHVPDITAPSPVSVVQSLLIILTVVAAFAQASLLAQTPNRPYLVSGALNNPYSFPVEVLVVHPSGVGYDKYRVVLVAARSANALSLPSGSLIANFTPIDIRVANAHSPVCASPGTLFTTLNATAAKNEIVIADQGGVDSTGTLQQESIAEAQGALEIAQTLDVINTNLNNPMTLEVNAENRQATGPESSAQILQDQQQQLETVVVTAIAGLASAQDDYLFTHDYAASQEADQLGDVVKTQQQIVADLQSKYDQSETRLKADLDFQAQTTAAMRQQGAGPIPSSPAHQIARACGGAANDQDIFALQMDAPANLIVLLAKANFDHGGEEQLVFRRIQGTSQWTATAYWPLEATSAKISVASGKGWTDLGSIDAGRPSVEQQLGDARKAVGKLKARKSSADYSGEGGDTTRTVVIP